MARCKLLVTGKKLRARKFENQGGVKRCEGFWSANPSQQRTDIQGEIFNVKHVKHFSGYKMRIYRHGECTACGEKSPPGIGLKTK